MAQQTSSLRGVATVLVTGATGSIGAHVTRLAARAAEEVDHRVRGAIVSSPERAVLHRCRTPTNWLCPCGRVARELRKHAVEHETVRVPMRRADRSEVDALTGQRTVPV